MALLLWSTRFRRGCAWTLRLSTARQVLSTLGAHTDSWTKTICICHYDVSIGESAWRGGSWPVLNSAHQPSSSRTSSSHCQFLCNDILNNHSQIHRAMAFHWYDTPPWRLRIDSILFFTTALLSCTAMSVTEGPSTNTCTASKLPCIDQRVEAVATSSGEQYQAKRHMRSYHFVYLFATHTNTSVFTIMYNPTRTKYTSKRFVRGSLMLSSHDVVRDTSVKRPAEM